MSLKQFFLQVAALLIVAFIGLYFFSDIKNVTKLNFFNGGPFGNPFFDNTLTEVPTKKVAIVDANNPAQIKTLINVEVADTVEKRNKGLSGRDSIASDSGMLFIFDKGGQHQFWMKGMLFPLDFIWINSDAVVDLLPNVPNPLPNTPDQALPVYGSTSNVDKVLEVGSGFISGHNIKVGDKLKLVN